MGQFDDQQVADVLNYVAVAWDNAAQLPDGFLGTRRVARIGGMELLEVYELRQALGLE